MREHNSSSHILYGYHYTRNWNIFQTIFTAVRYLKIPEPTVLLKGPRIPRLQRIQEPRNLASLKRCWEFKEYKISLGGLKSLGSSKKPLRNLSSKISKRLSIWIRDKTLETERVLGSLKFWKDVRAAPRIRRRKIIWSSEIKEIQRNSKIRRFLERPKRFKELLRPIQHREFLEKRKSMQKSRELKGFNEVFRVLERP